MNGRALYADDAVGQRLPESNGCRYYRPFPLRIGIVCDQFLYDSIKSAADFVYLSPDVTDRELSSLALVLVVSAWRGLRGGEWLRMLTPGSETHDRILQIADRCRALKVTTVFYSKEDPPNHELCRIIARKCDWIFTSAEECVASYRRACGSDRVGVMRFCINPLFHNPIGMRLAKEDGIIFSGSWMKKYPIRCRELAVLLDGIVRAGRKLVVVNRNSYRTELRNYRFPKRFNGFIRPCMEHVELVRLHKRFDWAVNINSVTRSRTMFAARVYELQAQGSLMLSNYSRGMAELFPDVFVAGRVNDVGRVLRAFDPDETYRLQVDAVRAVMTRDTCYERMHDMLAAVGVKAELPRRSILVVAESPDEGLRRMFAEQTFPDKRLLAIADVTPEEYGKADMVAFFGKGMEYGRHYLEDMANAFKYTACDYVTKDVSFAGGRAEYGVEHDYTGRMAGLDRTLFWRESFSWADLASMKGPADIPNGYAVDRFNFGPVGFWSGFDAALAQKLDKVRRTARCGAQSCRMYELWQAPWLPLPFRMLLGGCLCVYEYGWRHALRRLRRRMTVSNVSSASRGKS